VQQVQTQKQNEWRKNMTNPNPKIAVVSDIDSNVPMEYIEYAEALHHRSIATWAYIYSIPAFFALRQRSEFIQGWESAAKMGAAVTTGASAGAVGQAGVPPIGAWMMLPELANEKTMNALPMVDCLYGAAMLQMDKLGPVVISVPENPLNRYYSVVAVDSYLNNFSYIGPQWTANMANDFLIVPPDWKGEVPQWINRVWEAPTNQVTLYCRIFVKDEGSGIDKDGIYIPILTEIERSFVTPDISDIDKVRDWRKGIRLTQLSKWGEQDTKMPAIDLKPYVFDNLRTLSDPFEYFKLVFDFIGENPSGSDDEGLVQLFRTAGIGAGTSFPAEPHLKQAIAAGVKDAQDILNGAISGGEFKNGWRVPNKNVGKAGPFILDRAVYQLTQISSNVPQECKYIFGYCDEGGNVLDGSKGDYALTFSKDAFPPIKSPGFWSVTMYKKLDNLLAKNPINRFYIRSDTPGFTYNPDGSATISMAVEKPAGIPGGNWLPAPEEPFILGLRLYYPENDALSHRWFPPATVKVR
jgi:hypothetical protein